MNMSGFGQSAYTPTAKALHWITAFLVILMIPVGFVMARVDVPSAVYDLHKSVGPLILFITLYRLYYRLTHPPAPLPADLLEVQKLAAHATHWALYVLLIVQPLVGWIATSAYRAPIPFFGLFNLPPIWPENRALSEQLYAVHFWLGVALVLVIGMHVAGALFHFVVRKDRVLQRMLTD
jgi:cytochrome b561